MEALDVTLTQEVTRKDALIIGEWLGNTEITKYLNEAKNITSEINDIVSKFNTDIMTHLFNRNGTFCMILHGANEPVGFLKLVRKNVEAEIVLVIGEKEKWGQGIGTKSIEQGLSKVFFQWRMPRVIAKIHPGNIRSVKAFEKTGFHFESNLNNCKLYSITMERYIKRILT
ncbi:MAG: acetyltransferase, family [Herbinix sp.]|jgi:RimJ/RimL family protein N-acetyltransferase|nr:acetyltransferase, family [Herbinix sp.]